MFDWIKSVVTPPEPAGPPETLKTFTLSDPTIDLDSVTAEDEAWRLELEAEASIRLFEFPDPDIENCILTYRAEFKTEDAGGRTFLEMWCRFPGRGEFFSKGFNHAVKGTNDWASYETPFFLNTGQKPDLIKLNLAAEGPAKVWLRNIELLVTPFK